MKVIFHTSFMVNRFQSLFSWVQKNLWKLGIRIIVINDYFAYLISSGSGSSIDVDERKLKVVLCAANSAEWVTRLLNTSPIFFTNPVTNVADPDPHVFGPPGSGYGSTSQRYGSGSGSCSGSGSFHHHAKILGKTLIPTILWLLLTFYLCKMM